MTKILVIGDPHAHPRYDNDRFETIGAFARQREVDHVHCVGDWTDFPSLNMHKSMAEARLGVYEDDVEAGNDALVRFEKGLAAHPCTRSISMGNHDNYPEQYVASVDPTLKGTIGNDDVFFEHYGWKKSRFKQSKRVRGLLTVHYVPSATGRPLGGVHAAHTLLADQGESLVVGHSHVFDHKIKTLAKGRTIHGFVAGCMAHPKYDEGWCRGSKDRWQRGLLIVEMQRGGVAGFEWVTLDKVNKEVRK